MSEKLPWLWMALLVFGALPAQAGPWIRDAGDGYLKLSGSYFQGDQYYRAGVPTELDSRAQAMSVYGELGLGHALQLVVLMPYQVATNETAGGVRYANHTLGDTRLQLDIDLGAGFPLALNVGAKVPLYTPVAEQNLTGDEDAWRTNFPDVGDGNVDLTVQLQAGASLPGGTGWFTGALGYMKRAGDYVDSLIFSSQLGFWLWPAHMHLSIYTQGNINVRQDPFPELLASRESVSVEGTLAVTGFSRLPGVSMMVGVGEVVYARYAARGSMMTVGLAYAWDSD